MKKPYDKYYVVSHDDKRGIWGEISDKPVVPMRTLKEAKEHIGCMTGYPKIYKLVEVYQQEYWLYTKEERDYWKKRKK